MLDGPLLVLDLSLDIVDGVRRLDLKSDGLTREAEMRLSILYEKMVPPKSSRFDENLHVLCDARCVRTR